MAENTPSLADAHIVRTYPNDYAPSDTESEGEAQFEVEGETSAWVLEPQTWKTTEGTDVVLIRKPTASNLSHRLLNPFIYRNIQNVGTLDDLAALLDTPDDWEVRYNQVVDNGYIIDQMNRFRNLPDDTLESYIQSEFSALVSLVAGGLLVRICARIKTKHHCWRNLGQISIRSSQQDRSSFSRH
ncbi:hypothetical protein BASA61_004637 [Batrachochytrium salamandrivorans]|nr:hypothetical protein BASA61_004637 [Batrachochytrium salamandrivorans]